MTENLKNSLTEVLVGATKTTLDIFFWYLGNRIIHPPPLEEQHSLQPLRTTNAGKRMDLHFSILAALTKTMRSIHWLFFQNRMHQFLHFSWKFSLLLLCYIGSKACSAKLKNGSFNHPEQKLPKFEDVILYYPDLQLILYQHTAHQECHSWKN